jgi:kinesin family protein 1
MNGIKPTADGSSGAVLTAVRVRPMFADERKAGCRFIVSINGNQTVLTDPAGLKQAPSTSPVALTVSSHSRRKVWRDKFTFDYSYWSSDPNHPQYASQRQLYHDLGTHMLDNAWHGYNCSLFAYGQTGTGKSFSMMGATNNNNYNYNNNEKHNNNSNNNNNNNNDNDHRHHSTCEERQGLIPRICQGLFEKIQEEKDTPGHASMIATRYIVTMSYVEIYNERVYDLLAATTVKVCIVHNGSVFASVSTLERTIYMYIYIKILGYRTPSKCESTRAKARMSSMYRTRS